MPARWQRSSVSNRRDKAGAWVGALAVILVIGMVAFIAMKIRGQQAVPVYDGSVLRTAGAVMMVAFFALPDQSRAPDVYFAATRQAVADAMLMLAGVTADDVVYDLGSGDGRILILAAQKYGARGVGIEIDPELVALARQVAREGAVEDKVTFVEGDLFTADISPATVVTLYLSTTINAELEPKLRRQLRAGARIVSQQFPIGRWTPARTLRASGQELFFWIVPEP